MKWILAWARTPTQQTPEAITLYPVDVPIAS